jgi:hypothetical protein
MKLRILWTRVIQITDKSHTNYFSHILIPMPPAQNIILTFDTLHSRNGSFLKIYFTVASASSWLLFLCDHTLENPKLGLIL